MATQPQRVRPLFVRLGLILFALRWPGIAKVLTAQRSCLVKYAFMGISFILLLWVGTFYLML